MAVTRARPARGAAETAGRLVGLLVALAGLFVMHGLSDHGAAGHLEGAGSQVIATHHSLLSPDVAPPGQAVQAVAHAVHAVAISEVDGGTGGGSLGHELGMAGLCLAVLGAGVLLGLGVVRARARTTPGTDVGRVDPAIIPRRARAPDPPDLVRLSIRRC